MLYDAIRSSRIIMVCLFDLSTLNYFSTYEKLIADIGDLLALSILKKTNAPNVLSIDEILRLKVINISKN